MYIAGEKDNSHGGKETHLVTRETREGQAQTSQMKKNAHRSCRPGRNDPPLLIATSLLSKPSPKM